MTIRELKEKRANIYEQQKDIHAQASKENRAMNEEENAKWDLWEKDYADLSRQITQAEAMEDKDKENAVKPQNDISKDVNRKLSTDPKEREEQRNQAFDKYIRGQDTKEDRQILGSFETRTQTVGTTTEGGFLVPEGFSGQLDIQRAKWGGMRQAATIFRTAKGDQIPWPTVDDTSNTADTASESGDLTTSADDLVFSEKTFNAYKINSNLLTVSNELLQDSYFDMQGLLRDMFAERLGRKENSLFTTGSGSSTPNGVVTAATQAKRVASTTTFTRAELIDLVHSIDPFYRMSGKCGWMFRDATLGVIKKIDVGSSDSRPLWQPSMVSGAPDLLDGFPYWINQDVAAVAASAKSILFGDFGKYIIRDAGPVRFVRLDERYADVDKTGFVALARIDGDLLVSTAIKYLINATS